MALGLGNRTSAEVVTRTHATAVPRNAVRNTGLITVTLMDCIAAIASLAGRRARAFITQTEKAKNLGGNGGLIALDRRGNFAMPFNTSGMYRGRIGPDGKADVQIYR